MFRGGLLPAISEYNEYGRAVAVSKRKLCSMKKPGGSPRLNDPRMNDTLTSFASRS